MFINEHSEFNQVMEIAKQLDPSQKDLVVIMNCIRTLIAFSRFDDLQELIHAVLNEKPVSVIAVCILRGSFPARRKIALWNFFIGIASKQAEDSGADPKRLLMGLFEI